MALPGHHFQVIDPHLVTYWSSACVKSVPWIFRIRTSQELFSVGLNFPSLRLPTVKRAGKLSVKPLPLGPCPRGVGLCANKAREAQPKTIRARVGRCGPLDLRWTWTMALLSPSPADLTITSPALTATNRRGQ